MEKMYMVTAIQGLLANPKFLEIKDRWRNPSLFEELQSKQIDLKEIDSIFRRHDKEIDLIAEWIAARNWTKKIRKEFKLKTTEEVLRIFKEDRRKVLHEVQETLRTVEEKKAHLREKLVSLYGKKAMSRLSRDRVKWPVFSVLMIEVYKGLLEYFPAIPHYSNNPRDQREFATYPERLFEVISQLLQEYYPAYFRDFSPNSVKSRIQLSL